MYRISKRIFAFIFAVCMLVSSSGDLIPYVLAKGEPVVLTRDLTVSDGKTYEITVTYEREDDFPEDVELVVRELHAPEAPAQEAEAPAEETEAPAEETEAPAEEAEAPTEEAELFAEETEVPAQEAEVPAQEAEVPAEEAEVPAEEAEVPAEEAEVPAEKTEAPAEEAEAPAEEAEVPAEETEVPAEETEAPAEETEAPAEEAEVPAEEAEAPAEETEAPAEETAVPAEEAVAPAEETAVPAEEAVAPAEETEVPAEETEAHAEEAEVPAEEAEVPAEEAEAPAEEAEVPAEEAEVPAEETEAPAEEAEVPAEEAEVPAEEVEVPAEEAEVPAEEAEAPAEEAELPEEGYEYTYTEYVEQAARVLYCDPEDLTTVRIFDISLRDAVTGEELQPVNPVRVSIRLLENGLAEDTQVGVVHFGEEPEAMEVTVNEEAVEFETNSFSVYVIIEHEGDTVVVNPRVEFHFIDSVYTEHTSGSVFSYSAGPYNFLNKSALDSDSVYTNDVYQSTQILRDGETLEMIANPPTKIEKDNEGNIVSELFYYGWYAVELNGTDTTVYDPDLRKWTGVIPYTWTADPEKVEVEKPMTLTDENGDPFTANSVITAGVTKGKWQIGDAGGMGTFDSEGVLHVYLAPIFSDYYFLNFRMAMWSDTANATLANSLLTRRLVVFGNDNQQEVRIGSVFCPSPDAEHKVFAGWQEYEKEPTDFYHTVDMENSTSDTTVEANSPGHTDGYWITITEITDENDPDFGKNYYDLYPVFAEARWLYYDQGKSGNGAVYLPSSWKLTNDQGAGTYFDKLAKGTRQGYDFLGWYVNAATVDGKIMNKDGAYTLTTTVNGVSTSTDYNKAIQLTDGNGNFVDEVKGKYFYSLVSEVAAGQSKIYTTDADPAGNSDIYKLFQVTQEGKLYFYTHLEDLTVTALWEPHTVNYKVLFWLQNADDDGYTLAYYNTYQAKAGTVMYLNTAGQNDRTVYLDSDPDHSAADRTTYVEVDLSTTKDPSDNTKKSAIADVLTYLHLCNEPYKDYNGYTTEKVNDAEVTTETGVEIEGDESTIINVYYDRNVYRLRFDIGFARRTSTTGSTTVYAPMTPGEAENYTDTVYGIVDGTGVVLTKDDEGNWTYPGSEEVRNAYTGEYRYQVTTGNIGTQYGVVNGNVVELSGGITYSRTARAYYSVSNATNEGDYYIPDANGTLVRTHLYRNNNRWYRERTWNNGWRYGNEYAGTIYSTANDNQNVVGTSYTGTVYYFDATGAISTTGSGTPYGSTTNGGYFELTPNTNFTYNGGTSYGNGPRYLRVENGDSDSSYTLGFVDSAMRTVLQDQQGWYYTTQRVTTLPYTGTLYKQTDISGTWQYSVSNITGPNFNGTNNWDTFLTNSRYDLGTTNPFSFGEYTGYYQQTVSGTLYIVFYYDIVAKYGENIMEEYPGSQPVRRNGNNSYSFVGWLCQRDGYYNARLSTSIKGYLETVKEDLILTGGTIPGDNATINPLDPNDYIAITVDENNAYLESRGLPEHQGITQEFRCRYTGLDGAKKYLYRIYLADPDTRQYPAEPTAKFVITGGSGSNPNIQTPPTYSGYEVVEARGILRNGNEAVPTSGNYEDYEIPELTQAGVGTGMIMVFRLQPNKHNVFFNWGANAQQTVNGVTSSLTGPMTILNANGEHTVYYSQVVSFALTQEVVDAYYAEARSKTPHGYEFQGFYDNPDGLGEDKDDDGTPDPFDFSSKMPDGDVPLYAVYKPIKYKVIIDPNGAEIDHIDHTNRTYARYANLLPGDAFAAFNREVLYVLDADGNPTAEVERAADSGYRKDQSTYFNGNYGEAVGEYTVTRSYVPVSDEILNNFKGHVYYYVNMPFYSYYALASDNRNALYIDVTGAVPGALNTGMYKRDAQGNETAELTELYRYYLFYYGWTKGNLDGNYLRGQDIASYGEEKEPLDFDTWKGLYVVKQEGTNKAQVYRKVTSNETYAFLGWYKVNFDDAGNETGIGSMPYNFSDPVAGEMTLRAMWRLDGGYKVRYHADYTAANGTINGTIESWVDPKVGSDDLSYSAGAATTVFKAPYDITMNGIPTDEYIFRGYRVVNVRYIYDQNDPTHIIDTVYTPVRSGVYYDPGDAFTIYADYADSEGYIHLQAVYEPRDSAYRRPEVTNLTLDANGGNLTTGTGYVFNADTSAYDTWQDGVELEENTNLNRESGWKGLGTVSAVAYDIGGNKLQYPAIEFGDFQSNAAVNLYRYATAIDTVGGSGVTALNPPGVNYFVHPENYFLLGFDEKRNEGDFIATYPADGIISVQRTDDVTLYAVWEPMIYLNIENNTEKDITFGLSSTGALTLYIVNEKKGLYDREKVDDASHITVSAGTTLHLSLPLAEEQEITLRGVNQLGVGKILTWDTSITDDGTGITYTSQEGQDTDEIRYNQTEYTGTHVYNSASCTHTLARGQVDSTGSGEYEITEKLLFNSKGLTVIFDDKNADYALVLDDNYPGGTTQEYDFSAEEIAPENSVPKTKELPGSSTRMGYQLLGWAYDPNATEPDFSATKPSTDAPWTITDLQAFFTDNPNAIPNGAWPKENGAATTVATLYAVWDVNDEARFVYIYKNVPLPGNRNTEFSFTFTLTGKYRATDKDDQDVSASGAFQLKHGEYAVLESEEHTDTALIQTKITVYNADGTKKSVNTPAEWQGTPYAGGGFEELLFTVTEASETYYDTTVTRTAQTAANPITLEGTRIADEADPDDPNTDPETHSTNTVHWNRTDAGGTLVFTNTRQTFNITLEKTEHSNTTVPGTFSFTAKYTLDGDTANVYTVSDIQVTSGTPNTNGLEDTPVGLFGMPAGADLTITEVNDGSYITKVKVDDGSWQENTTSVDLTVDAHKTVYFDNTLKSYHVDFKKVDQALQPTVNALFNLTGPAAFSRVNLYAKSGDGVFYKHDTDGDLWVGSYTLTETSVSEGYVGLSTPVTITLNGDAAEGSNVTCSDQNVLIQYDSATQVYTVYVINQRMVRYTVEKELVDALIPKRDFKFSYSYTADYDYTINGEEVHRNLSGSGTKTFMSGEANWSFDAPVGAALTITEEDYEGSKSNYDVTYKVGSGSYVNGNENYSYTMTVPDTPQTTVTFRNTRKTQDVTVKKLTVPDTDTTTSFGFTATLSLNVGGAAIDYDSNGFTDGVRTFNLTNTQTQVLKIPAGATIEVKELGSASYEPVSIESAEYADSDSNKASFTVRNVGKPGTITFTNRKVVSVTVKKTLVDALKPDQTFRFSASYVIDGKTTAMPVFNLGHNGEEVLSVPSGSKLTITETVDSSIYDTTVNGSPAQSYVIESATEDVTVVFANTRKTVKLIINNALEDTWNPTTVFNYTVSAAETGNSGNTMALDPADSSFSLPHGGTKEIILPVGTTVTVTEISTAAGDPALTYYDTTANGTTGTGYTHDVTAAEADTEITVPYVNIRKTVEVTVVKELKQDPIGKTFPFTWQLDTAEAVSFDMAVSVAAGGSTPAQDLSGSKSNVLTTETVKFPVGGKLTITEKLADTSFKDYFSTLVLLKGTTTGTTLMGSADTLSLTIDPLPAEEGGITAVFTNTRALADVTLQKTLSDPLVTAGKDFRFAVQVSETINGTTYNAVLPEITIANVQNDLAATKTASFKAPVGMKLVVTEQDAQNYTVTATGTAGGTGAAQVYTLNSLPAAGDTITFTNVRKTVEVTVVKELEDDSTTEFDFSAALLEKGVPVTYGDFTAGTNNNEAAPFKLKADGATKQLFTVPVGTVLVITENLTAEQQEAYSTSAEATATGTGSTTSSVAKVTGETNAYALTVADDTPVTVTVTNTSLGIDVSFEKINGTATGENMGTAQFTLYTSYTDETHNTPFQKAGSNVVSSSTVTGSGESTVTTITFEKVPFGVYYMRETTVPTGYTNANTYILLVGAANLTNSGTGLWASGAVLGDIRTEDVTAQRGAKVGEKYERDYAIFLIEDGKAVATPNIADKGLLNTDKRERKVILKKTDQANAPLSGAVFSILRADLSVLASGLTSGSNGAFWIGTLPYGIYYLHETTVPSGYRTLGTGDNWYRIQVDENGVSEPQRLSAKP